MSKERIEAKVLELLVELEIKGYIEDRLEYSFEDFVSSYPSLDKNEITLLTTYIIEFSSYYGSIYNYLESLGYRYELVVDRDSIYIIRVYPNPRYPKLGKITELDRIERDLYRI